MCFICDGHSHEDLERVIELTILTHGWYVQGVGPSDDEPDGSHWAYTIGLTEGFGLPELIVTDTDYSDARVFLNLCADMLTAGVTFEELDEMGIISRQVAEPHLTGELFFGWARHYDISGAAANVMQVVQPPNAFCACCYPTIADLSNPDEPFPRPLPLADTA